MQSFLSQVVKLWDEKSVIHFFFFFYFFDTNAIASFHMKESASIICEPKLMPQLLDKRFSS